MIQEKAIQAGVARVFDDAASYYRDMRWEKNRVVRFEQLLTRQTIEEELGGDSVAKALELGCGPGTWTGTLSDRAGRVLAVDLSQAMLGRPAKRSPSDRTSSFATSTSAHLTRAARPSTGSSASASSSTSPSGGRRWKRLVVGLHRAGGPSSSRRRLSRSGAAPGGNGGLGRERWDGASPGAR